MEKSETVPEKVAVTDYEIIIAADNRIQDTEKALRLRDNKRRHRARRKEYIVELERKASQFQNERVQATIEVQLSARKVVDENRRLRELLHRSGYSDEAINSWVSQPELNTDETNPLGRGSGSIQPQDEPSSHIGSTTVNSGEPQEITREISEMEDVTASTESGPGLPPVRTCSTQSSESSCRKESSCRTATAPPPLVEHAQSISGAAQPAEETAPTCQPDSGAGPTCLKRCSRDGTGSPMETSSTKPRIAPCKVLQHLAAHPGTEISDLSIESDDDCVDADRVDAGVPCSQAYKILACYATTASRCEAVAQVLEAGCVPNAGPGGGCKVPNSAVWQALDDLSL